MILIVFYLCICDDVYVYAFFMFMMIQIKRNLHILMKMHKYFWYPHIYDDVYMN